MITTNQLKIGMTLELEDGVLFEVLDFQHVKPGKGPAFVRTKLRNLKAGSVIDRTFRAGEKVQPAHLEQHKAQYLYQEGDNYIFMDMTSYEQYPLTAEQLGDALKYLKENMEVDIRFYQGRALSIELPITVELEVTQTDPGFKGDTATGGTKPATLETGVVVQVPLFIETGDTLKVDTRTGQYLTRV